MMSYYEAALAVLKSARKPLTTKEITERAIADGLVAPHGKAPNATMAAVLYRRLATDDRLVKRAVPSAKGTERAVQGTVRWTLRKQ